MDVYKEIQKQFDRLKGHQVKTDDYRDLLYDVLYYYLTDEDYEKIQLDDDGKIDLIMFSGLYEDTLFKIVGTMEAFEKWEDFEKLYRKKKPKKQEELTDFEKILKAIAKVPKPPKKDKKPSDE